MNTTKGIRILTSGNQLHWEHMRLSNRGSVQGSFSSEPSAADTEEGFRFLASLAPEHARQITTQSSRSQGEQMRDAFLFGGSQN